MLANMGLRPSRWQLYFTVSTMIATVNSVVGGSVVAILIGRVFDAPLGVASAIGALAAAISFVAHQRWDRFLHMRGAGNVDVMFPSPPPPA